MTQDYSKANAILFKMIESATLSVLSVEAKLADLQARKLDLKTSDLQYIEEIACILLLGEDIKITLKAHYWLDDAIGIIQSMRTYPSNVDLQQKARDFFKELCNIIAGKIKFHLLNLGCKVGQSLPVALDGFTEIFFHKNRKAEFLHAWVVSNPQLEVLFSISVIYFSKTLPQKIISVEGKDFQAPEVEFL